MTSGFIRAMVIVILAGGLALGFGTVLVEADRHDAGLGIVIGFGIFLGAAIQAALLWLFVEMHDDVAAIRGGLTGLQREQRSARAVAAESGQPWSGPEPDAEPGDWERQQARLDEFGKSVEQKL